MFRKNSFFTPEVHEVEYQERVREHALRLDNPQSEKKDVSLDQIDDRVREALDERDVGA